MSRFRARLVVEQVLAPTEETPHWPGVETLASFEVRADDLSSVVRQIAEHANTLVTRHEPATAAIPERKTFGYLAGQP